MPREIVRRRAEAVPAVSVIAAAIGAAAFGAIAVGAIAIGALAIGRLAVGRVTVKQAPDDVVAAGRADRHDDLHRAIGIGLRAGAHGRCDQSSEREQHGWQRG